MPALRFLSLSCLRVVAGVLLLSVVVLLGLAPRVPTAHASTLLAYVQTIDCKLYLQQFTAESTSELGATSQEGSGPVGFLQGSVSYTPSFTWKGTTYDASFAGTGTQLFSDRKNFDPTQADQVYFTIDDPSTSSSRPVTVTVVLLSWGNATYTFTPTCTPAGMFGSPDGRWLYYIDLSGYYNSTPPKTITESSCYSLLYPFNQQGTYQVSFTDSVAPNLVRYASGTVQYYPGVTVSGVTYPPYLWGRLTLEQLPGLTLPSYLANYMDLSIPLYTASGFSSTYTYYGPSSDPYTDTYTFQPACSTGVMYTGSSYYDNSPTGDFLMVSIH